MKEVPYNNLITFLKAAPADVIYELGLYGKLDESEFLPDPYEMAFRSGARNTILKLLALAERDPVKEILNATKQRKLFNARYNRNKG